MHQELVPREITYKIILQRFQDIFHPLMPIAYILDPIARQERPAPISANFIGKIGEWLREYSPSNASSLLAELIKVMEKKSPFDNVFMWETASSSEDPILFWRIYEGASPELIKLATLALSIAPTSGSAEQNWSTFGFIHSKSRNRLTNERVEKLVYIYWNQRIRKEIQGQLTFDFIEAWEDQEGQREEGESRGDSEDEGDGEVEQQAGTEQEGEEA